MKHTLIALFLTLWAGTLAAQDLPALFSVTGVQTGDVLNIRAAPDAGAAKVGEFGQYGFNIEVLETTADGGWGLVGIPEGNGWVSMRYMARQEVEPYAIPRPISCVGTEPFWRISLYPRGSEYEMMGEPRSDLTLLSETVAPNGYLAVLEQGPTLNHTLIVERGACSDGMSDRRFGWRAMLFLDAPDRALVHSGCCSLGDN